MKNTARYVALFGAFAMLGVGGIAGWTVVARRFEQRITPSVMANEIHAAIIEAAKPRTLREQAKLIAADFYETPHALDACSVIATHDLQRLRGLINSGVDTNVRGKSGLTLLHWALLSENLDAFKLLLASGADLDNTLTESISFPAAHGFYAGDSVLFACCQFHQTNKWEFFFAALDHSSEKDPRDSSGNTLLLRCMGPNVIFSVKEEVVVRIIDHGVDLDAQDSRLGCTAAKVALSWGRPDFCRKILEAGADPDIRDKRGNTIADDMEVRSIQEGMFGSANHPAELKRLAIWLADHANQVQP